MKTEVHLAAAIGKTLKAVEFGLNKQVVLVFADDTFVTLGINRGYESSDDEIEEVTLELYEFGDSKLITAGIVTREEIEGMRNSRKAESDAHKEEWERKEFERLRQKFEGTQK